MSEKMYRDAETKLKEIAAELAQMEEKRETLIKEKRTYERVLKTLEIFAGIKGEKIKVKKQDKPNAETKTKPMSEPKEAKMYGNNF